MTQAKALDILAEVYQGCSKIFPQAIENVYLYGSYARGDFDKESDVDIFFTVDMDWEGISRYSKQFDHFVSELSLKYDVLVSVMVNPLALFLQFDELPYFMNVKNEGIRYDK